MRRSVVAMALFVAPAYASVSCIFPDLSDFQRCDHGCDGAGGSAASSGGGGQSAGGSTGSQSSAAGGGGQGQGGSDPCALGPSQHGSKGVANTGLHVEGKRCIDAFEATWLDYDEFLQTYDFDGIPGAIQDVCSWKTEWEPTYYQTFTKDPTQYGKRPVLGVDWCDARLFCSWAGKSLCGDESGEPVERDSGPDSAWTTSTEWYRACQANAPPNDPDCYPTGTFPTPIQKSTDVDNPACMGDLGMYHALSNVWEWGDNCVAGGDPELDDCRYVGAVGLSDGELPDCSWANPDVPSQRNRKGDSVGVRCCWDAEK